MFKSPALIALMILALIAAGSLEAAAMSSFADLPSDHWIYDELIKLVDAGLVEEYGRGEVLRTRPQLTRYEVALIVGRVHSRLENQEMALVEDSLLEASSSDWTAGDLDGVFRTMDRPLWERIFIHMITIDERPDFAAKTQEEIARLRHVAGEAATALMVLTGELDSEMSVLGLPAASMSVSGGLNSIFQEIGQLGFSKIATGGPVGLMSEVEPVFLSRAIHVERTALKRPFAW